MFVFMVAWDLKEREYMGKLIADKVKVICMFHASTFSATSDYIKLFKEVHAAVVLSNFDV